MFVRCMGSTLSSRVVWVGFSFPFMFVLYFMFVRCMGCSSCSCVMFVRCMGSMRFFAYASYVVRMGCGLCSRVVSLRPAACDGMDAFFLRMRRTSYERVVFYVRALYAYGLRSATEWMVFFCV